MEPPLKTSKLDSPKNGRHFFPWPLGVWFVLAGAFLGAGEKAPG